MTSTRKPHAIIIPIPHQGHIKPSIDLALKLAKNGFVVTFVNLEFVHQQMVSNFSGCEDDIFHGARGLGLDIRYRTISDGFPIEFDRVLYLYDFWESMLRDFHARVDALVGEIIQSDPCLDHFLIVDTLFGWPAAVANKYNLVNVSLWTEPAIVFSLIYHADEVLRQHGHFPCKDGVEEDISYVPGIKSINTKDFMPYLRESDIETTSHKVVFGGFKDVRKADFILHNTVHELESETVSALNKYQCNYAIGPIYFSKGFPTNAVRKTLWPESDCSKWLDAKPRGSVLYVSFGSLVQASKREIEEIAYGLLLSGVKFIWVIRAGILGPDAGHDDNVLPKGFMDDIIKDRGLIIPWCNQIKVLESPAVGGFLTHCGWNSILESIWCGVPMICYPLDYDQPTNRKLVVDDWKIGVNLCDGKFADRKEIAEKIKILMSGSTSMAFNQNMIAVRDKSKTAVEIGGSSETNFDQFVRDLKEKIESMT